MFCMFWLLLCMNYSLFRTLTTIYWDCCFFFNIGSQWCHRGQNFLLWSNHQQVRFHKSISFSSHFKCESLWPHTKNWLCSMVHWLYWYFFQDVAKEICCMFLSLLILCTFLKMSFFIKIAFIYFQFIYFPFLTCLLFLRHICFLLQL